MTVFDPVVALAATPRGWAQRLHRHVADHGGARVRATVLHPRDLEQEEFEVFCADDVTSFLTVQLVDALHRGGRAVLGVFDAEDDRGKGELLAMGVDAVVEQGASAEELLTAVRGLAVLIRRDAREPALPRDAGPSLPSGALVAVGGPSGGVGATEIAIELARALSHDGGAVVLVDGDDHAPGLAARLGVAQYPNLRAALDAQRAGVDAAGALQPLTGDGRLGAMAGLTAPRDWSELRPGDVLAVAKALAAGRDAVVVNIGSCLDDAAGSGRYVQTREVAAAADLLVAVATPTPLGVARLAEWLADVAALPRRAPAHVVVNQAPSGSWQRQELLAEVDRCCATASLSVVPFDGRVTRAAWDGGPVARGPFTRAVAKLAEELAPALDAAARRQGAGTWL